MHADWAQRLLPNKVAAEVEGDHDAGQAGAAASWRQPTGPHAELHLESEPRSAFPTDRGYSKATGCLAEHGQSTSDVAIAAATSADASQQPPDVNARRLEVNHAVAAESEHYVEVADLSWGC